MDAHAIERILLDKRYKFPLAVLKGIRNGIVYGTRIRAPHALVMTFLFSDAALIDKFLTILKLTKTHALNLAKFTGSYKTLTGVLRATEGKRSQWHSFVAAFCVGYFVFGNYNGVNMQINLYLLSRITVGFARLAVKKGLIPEPNFPVFPLFAGCVWACVLWLFEYHQETLQPSLQNSMTYLYHDSNHWTSLKDFFWVNKL